MDRGSRRGGGSRRGSHMINASDFNDMIKSNGNLTEPNMSNAFSSPDPKRNRRLIRMGTTPRDTMNKLSDATNSK